MILGTSFTLLIPNVQTVIFFSHTPWAKLFCMDLGFLQEEAPKVVAEPEPKKVDVKEAFLGVKRSFMGLDCTTGSKCIIDYSKIWQTLMRFQKEHSTRLEMSLNVIDARFNHQLHAFHSSGRWKRLTPISSLPGAWDCFPKVLGM